MVQICSKCSRANPEEACYCYFDGFVLGQGARNGGPVAVGAQAFAHPFVFPSGRSCRNFDELTIGCQEDWSSACEMLGQGHLETFFGGLGRIDLVMAAKEASKFPDHDRALDQLLAKMPSDVLASPMLGVETREINLGVVKVGEGRDFTLHLENKGMRLLYGTISCSGSKDVWLTLGDTPGTTEKHFQFGGDQTVKVKVVGDRLRANVKPLEAKLIIDSNGGQETVTIRAEVPVQPFPTGALGGSKSPRDLAMKAKLHIKEAAPCFERGEIEKWYKDNGWNYPVQGPGFSGIHAIQQFFEALGLVKPPSVAIDTEAIALSGNPGDRLSYEIKIESPEKKPVYAYATSDVPWIQPEKARLSGRTASISVVVPAVPTKPGKTLSAKLTVHSNGNKHFEVPVSLAVAGNTFDFNGSSGPEPELEAVADVEPIDEVVAEVEPVVEVERVAAVAIPAMAQAAVATVASLASARTATLPPPVAVIASPPPVLTAAVPDTLESLTEESSAPTGRTIRSRRAAPATPLWMHLIPAGMLGLAVLGVVIFDLKKPLGSKSHQETGVPPGDPVDVQGWTYGNLKDSQPLLAAQFNDKRRGSFGLIMTREKDPNNPDEPKRLTYDPFGSGNNTIVHIDGYEYYYHLSTPENRPLQIKDPSPPKPRIGRISGMHFSRQDVEVMQHTEIVPGASGYLDTCLVWFTITNRSKLAHKVGLRVLFDTYIGANDGVPFTIPGRKGFLDTMKDFPEKEVPDYIEAIEKPDTPKDPGTVARMGLKNINLPNLDLEPIDKLRICGYPGSQTKWNWEPFPMNNNPDQPNKRDSAVAIYWVYRDMNPGEVRQLAFTYGLSELSVSAGDAQIALSAPNSVQPNSDFIITAYVWNAQKDQKVTLELPAGLSLLQDETADKLIEEAGNRVQVSWRVKAGAAGEHAVTAKTRTTITKPFKVIVRKGSLFG